MRYAIISDIHSNFEALESTILAARSAGARKIFCTGDIVGYGADPDQCIEMLQEMKVLSIAGNHDWAVCGKILLDRFNAAARASIEWTQNNIKKNNETYLYGLELTREVDRFTLVHGSLLDPQTFPYVKDLVEANETFYLMQTPICFIGHSHVPHIFVQGHGKTFMANGLAVEMKKGYKYIVNVGSVGQPRDGNPQACYGLYDPDIGRIEIKRVSYDIERAKQKILMAGLPSSLGERLVIGQ